MEVTFSTPQEVTWSHQQWPEWPHSFVVYGSSHLVNTQRKNTPQKQQANDSNDQKLSVPPGLSSSLGHLAAAPTASRLAPGDQRTAAHAHGTERHRGE